jgi:hypothetical protein
MINQFYVYIHRKATNGEVFYVGKGKDNRAYDNRIRNKHWHNIVNKHGLIVEFAKTDISEAEAFELEEHLIHFFGRFDLGKGVLVNMTDGGEGASGHVHSEETRKKIGYSSTLRLTGKTLSEETKLKMSEAHKGKTISEETKLKMSDAKKGEKHPCFGKRGETSHQWGKTHTEETKRKISESQSGDKAYWYNKQRSDETRNKMKISAKLAWEKRKQQTGEVKC